MGRISIISLRNFNDISNRFAFLTEKITFLNFNTIVKKLAFYLLEKNAPEVKLKLSIKQLAEFFGVERPSLSKVIGDIVKAGVIQQIDRRTIRIIDKEALVELVER